MDTIRFKALGADPEVFLIDKAGKPVSAEGLFGGTKYEPKPMGIGPGFYIQEDNVAAEYNIPPARSGREFANNIITGLSYIKNVARKNGLRIRLESAMNFDEKYLSTPHAQTLGCEPDFDIWKMCINPRPEPPKLLRTAAGHVHISWENPTPDQLQAVVRAFDVYVVVPSILVTKRNERRSLYGRAGAFRPKDYGVECRALDNFWVGNVRDCHHIFEQTLRMINLLNHEDEWIMEDMQEAQEDIQNCINNHDPDLALKIMENFQAQPFPIIQRAYAD
jgi:hypothetical protein